MALPKKHRLRDRRDFAAVYRWGLQVGSEHLTLRILGPPTRFRGLSDFAVGYNPKELPPRVAIVVSQKVSKRAVIRNRLRRQVQGLMHQFLDRIPWGWRLIITVKPKAITASYDQFLQELKQLFLEAEVLDGHS